MTKPSGKSKTLRHNCILAVLSLLMLALAFGLDPDEGVNSATADDLSAPPLIWEAPPAKERAPDNSYYNKQKAAKNAIAPSVGTSDSAAPPRKTKDRPIPRGQAEPGVAASGEPATNMPMVSGSGDEGISVQEYEAMRAPEGDGDAETGTPGVSEGYNPDEDANKVDDDASRAPKDPNGADCNYSHFVGKNISSVDFSLFGKRRTRVIYPGQAVTMDFSADRINFEVTKEGTVTRVACY